MKLEGCWSWYRFQCEVLRDQDFRKKAAKSGIVNIDLRYKK